MAFGYGRSRLPCGCRAFPATTNRPPSLTRFEEPFVPIVRIRHFQPVQLTEGCLCGGNRHLRFGGVQSGTRRTTAGTVNVKGGRASSKELPTFHAGASAATESASTIDITTAAGIGRRGFARSTFAVDRRRRLASSTTIAKVLLGSFRRDCATGRPSPPRTDALVDIQAVPPNASSRP